MSLSLSRRKDFHNFNTFFKENKITMLLLLRQRKFRISTEEHILLF